MTYFVILTSELYLVDFTELNETNASTARKSLNGQKTLLSWDEEEYPQEPSFVSQVSYKEVYHNEEIYPVIYSPEWKPIQ